MSLKRWRLISFALLVGCVTATEPVDVPSATSGAPVSSERRPAGIRATLETTAVPRPGSPWRLTVKFERLPHFRLPVDLTVRPPAGVVLRRGRALRERFGSDVTEVAYEFDVGATVGTDLVVEVDVRGSAAGYHAELHYSPRGSRPAARLSARSGRQVYVAGRAVGAAVEMPGGAVER